MISDRDGKRRRRLGWISNWISVLGFDKIYLMQAQHSWSVHSTWIPNSFLHMPDGSFFLRFLCCQSALHDVIDKVPQLRAELIKT